MTPSREARSGRDRRLDLARGVAVVGMVAFHLCYDLAHFGLVDWDTARDWRWQAFAGSVAGSFLMLSGVALVYAHGRTFRLRAFVRRLTGIVLAAALVSGVTFMAMPFPVRFGILHAIALFSVLAIPFLCAPPWVAGAAAVACVGIDLGAFLPDFDHWLAYPLGLAAHTPPSPDYLPLFPWFAATLAGVALGRTVPARRGPRSSPGPLLWAGRHSLTIYLLHQPVLFAAFTLWLKVAESGQGRPAAF